ncbi:O-antigen ligase [Planomicrobium sp. CPCC 101079]|uniref:O-antigen ligase family protein n=1 Tax=Planomicrobium sp. CPCC 101079 TaxID=2599618 RepID=UPI0011B57DD2|nr:O-antigen ligase family protein [Planomicrobium sp. CPCC 101079]TWT04589.1 O-antigen ligase family protein [Planomicrobium sp. CPCC 101079]
MENLVRKVDSKELLLLVGALIYASAAAVYHPLILLALLGLVYFVVNRKLLYLFTVPVSVLYIFYLPVGNSMLNISFILVLSIAILSLLLSFKSHFSQKISWIYIVYLLGLSTGILYAPDRELGFKLMLINILGFLVILVGQRIAAKSSSIKLLESLSLIGLPIGILNIIFLLMPNLEISFLQGSISELFIERGTVNALFDAGKNNILDPSKAGTFFVNTNVAAVFFGILFWITLAVRIQSNNKAHNITLFIYLGALLATNSRAGLIALLFSFFFLWVLNSNKKKAWIRSVILLLPIIVIGILIMNSGYFVNIVDRLSLSALQNDPRWMIWNFALSNTPYIQGLGYGGWEQISFRMGPYLGSFPPHNIYLIAWTWSGIVGVFSLCLLLFGVLFSSTKKYKQTKNPLYLALIGSYIIVIVQGMFDNYFLHDYRILLILFLITGSILYKPIKKEGI